LQLGEQGVLENVKVVHTKSGRRYLRTTANITSVDNLEKIAITCNDKDYLLFDYDYLYLKAINGKVKRKWKACSGMPGSTVKDQDKKDFGPLPEGIYTVNFDKTLDYKSNTGLWDAFKWKVKKLNWGLVATPLLPDSKNKMYGRGDFFIHGGNVPGSEGCIDLVDLNQDFHAFVRLYHRNFKLIVRYK
jgi:hypothetical protein